MKVTKQATEVKFQPVTISVTFETKDELDAIQLMCGMELSVPEYLVNEKLLPERLQGVLSTVMAAIHNGVHYGVHYGK